MKRETIELSQERSVLTMMIVSTEFLNQIAPVIQSKYFRSSYAKTVSEWIIEYWQEFKEAPEKNIQKIYQQKIGKLRNEEDTEIIMKFISRLSRDYVKTKEIKNIDFHVKESIHYLKLQSLEAIKDEIEQSILQNDPGQGEQIIAKYARIEKSGSKSIRILVDTSGIASAFLNEDEKIFRFPGILGDVCGNFLRGDLVSFLAAPKRGKTYWQWCLSYMAMFSGLRTVFFSLEMTENQILRRAWQSLTGSPINDSEIELPYFIRSEKNEEKWKVRTEKQKRKGVNIAEISKKQKKLKLHCRGGDVLIKAMPMNATSIDGIERELDNIRYYDNYIPDIVVIDYADILLHSKKAEYRHQIDHTWKEMRRIAKDRNILVVTASQTTRGAINKDADEESIAEDIRKLAHVSKMMVINQSKEDRKNNALRIAQLAERDGKRNYRQAYVIYCLDIGKPYLDSRYADEMEDYKK